MRDARARPDCLRRSPQAKLRPVGFLMDQEIVREERLIVGLGNPESEYADTRHNLGFACVGELARRLGVRVDRKRWQSLVGRSDAERVWLLMPQTYMNLSGQAVVRALRDTGVTPLETWVVYDELDLPLCRMRIRRGGSGAGHNGVLSIIGSLGTPDFVRFRVGIGKPASKGSPAGRHHVLGRFTKREAERLPGVVDGVATALQLALEAGVDRAMDVYNRAGALGCDEPE
ncbi:aminoacyl-tRNA hydrolase [bacterium]|nr:MAG: aminoacyl-tRNA hydrolase [bacterium]